jgi:hypothetical protein
MFLLIPGSGRAHSPHHPGTACRAAGTVPRGYAILRAFPAANSMAKKRLYRVIFINQGKVYEIYARRVCQGNLFGFIEIADLVFGEKSSVVIDPSEDRLRSEFEGVPVSHVPLHAVIRIDEVEKQGTAKIVPISGKIEDLMGAGARFPTPGNDQKNGS